MPKSNMWDHSKNPRKTSLNVYLLSELWSVIFWGFSRVAFRRSVSQNSFHGNTKILFVFATNIYANYAKETMDKTGAP